MSTDMRTVGDMLREAGYYTAYKGKWHLTKEFETVNKLGTPTKIFTEEMEAYGFSDYIGDRRHHRAHPGRLPARRHYRRDGRQLAARQGARTGGRRTSRGSWRSIWSTRTT